MQLNHECVRKMLLFIEDSIQYTQTQQGEMEPNSLGLKQFYEADRLSGFSQVDIWYTILQLLNEDYIAGYKIPKGLTNEMTLCKVDGMTMKGHDLVNNIRENPAWTETKKRIGGVGRASLKVLTDIATTVTIELAKA